MQLATRMNLIYYFSILYF